VEINRAENGSEQKQQRLSDGEHDQKVGPRKPPLHTRFRKGQSGNPCRRTRRTCRCSWPTRWTSRSSSRQTEAPPVQWVKKSRSVAWPVAAASCSRKLR